MKLLPTPPRIASGPERRWKFRRTPLSAGLAVAALAAATLGLGGAPSAQASLASHYVHPVYIIPADAPHRNAQDAILRAHQEIQRQWASWGWTFRLSREVRTIHTSRTCADFTGLGSENQRVFDTIVATVKEKFGEQPNVIRPTFVECSNTGYAAHGGGKELFFYDGVIQSLRQQVYSTAPNRNDVGVIGHELGHTFGLPHEQCTPNDTNAADLAARGYPTAVSRSVMCNNFWPDIQPPMPYQRTLAFATRCEWLLECSGAGAYGEQSAPILKTAPPVISSPVKSSPAPSAPVIKKSKSPLPSWLFVYL
ncbi:MAG: M12 family metallo-peptidase, partial [Angustibacter sp.]